ncbi:MAG: hypothetical protein JZU65_01700 [Chlorobium sp.]|jgi:hypothetical protein|nr:hypothetical protein [Chlorobium sp.]
MFITIHARLLPVPVIALFILQGCGNPSQNGKEEKPAVQQAQKITIIEPSHLVTQQDAEKILGEPVMEAVRTEKPIVGLKLCMYNPVNEQSTSFLQITLTQNGFMLPEGTSTASIYNRLKKNFEGTRTDIRDLGDDAFIATGGLYILKENCYIMIAAGNINSEVTRTILMDAGKTALDNLSRLK